MRMEQHRIHMCQLGATIVQSQNRFLGCFYAMYSLAVRSKFVTVSLSLLCTSHLRDSGRSVESIFVKTNSRRLFQLERNVDTFTAR